MAIVIEDPTLLDTFLYYGLFVGALFQLACICAVVFIPQSENEEETEETGTETKSSPPQPTSSDRKSGRREKKKHR